MTGEGSGSRPQRILLGALGIAVIVLGILLLFLPGPGLLLILVGLWILGREYQWSQKLLRTLRERNREKSRAARGRGTL